MSSFLSIIPGALCVTVNIFLDHSQVRGVEYHFFVIICSSDARKFTLGVLYGYKVVLQAITVIMALKTRKVKVRGLDDYREIIMATYLTSFVLVIILIINYTVEDQRNTFTALTSLSFFTAATATILLVFVPKVTSFQSCWGSLLITLQMTLVNVHIM